MATVATLNNQLMLVVTLLVCIFLFSLAMFLVGSNIIKVWDILGGGRLLAGFSNHQKTITSICFDGEHQHLLSGSLDRYFWYFFPVFLCVGKVPGGSEI